MKLTQEQKAFVEDLLSRMTLDEKIGQMNQESPSIVGGFDVPFSELIEMMTDGRISQEEFGRIMSTAKQDFHEDDIRAGLVGSQMVNDPRQNNALQKIAVEESRLGIPLIIGFDVIHGFRSVFPIAIGEACSFDDALFEETAHMAAAESRAHGINWNSTGPEARRCQPASAQAATARAWTVGTATVALSRALATPLPGQLQPTHREG